MKNKLLTIRQAAEWVGVTKDKFDGWVGPGMIPAIRPRQRWRYVWLFDVLNFFSRSQDQYSLECHERLARRAREEDEKGK